MVLVVVIVGFYPSLFYNLSFLNIGYWYSNLLLTLQSNILTMAITFQLLARNVRI